MRYVLPVGLSLLVRFAACGQELAGSWHTWVHEMHCVLGAVESAGGEDTGTKKVEAEVECVEVSEGFSRKDPYSALPPEGEVSLLTAIYCLEGGKPLLMLFEENGVRPFGSMRSVLIDLRTRAWLAFRCELASREARRMVREWADECPQCDPDLLSYRLMKENLLDTRCVLETDQIRLSEIYVPQSRTDEEVKSWWNDKVMPLIEESDPEFAKSLRRLSRTIKYAKDLEGKPCCFSSLGYLRGTLPFMDDSDRGLRRPCEEEISGIRNKDEPSYWQELIDKFSKWDTWPEFPNMKHFKF